MKSYAPLKVKHITVHPSTQNVQASIGIKSLLRKSKNPPLRYSFKCSPGNSSNLLQHVFTYSAGSKQEEELFLRCSQRLIKMKHFTLLSILRSKVNLKRQEVTFVVPHYKGISLSEHVFVAMQNKFYLHEEELWAILGQLLLFCSYILSEGLQIAEHVCNHLSINHIYYVASLPHMEDSRGCIKINILEILLRESVSLESTMLDSTAEKSDVFALQDVRSRLFSKVYSIMVTLINLQSTAHSTMGLPPSLMTPMQMNRVLSTISHVGHKKGQWHDSDLSLFLTQNEDDIFSTADKADTGHELKTARHRRNKLSILPRVRRPKEPANIFMDSDESTDKSIIEISIASYISKARRAASAQQDDFTQEPTEIQQGTTASSNVPTEIDIDPNRLEKELQNTVTIVGPPKSAVSLNLDPQGTDSSGRQSVDPTHSAHSVSLYLESVMAVGDLSMVDTDYNFPLHTTVSAMQHPTDLDKYSMELHNAVKMLQMANSFNELYKVTPLAKLVDQLELLYADNDKVRASSLRYSVITDNVQMVRKLVRKLPITERSTPLKLSYSAKSHYLTELMLAIILRNSMIIKALIPYQANLLLHDVNSVRPNALSIAIQNYIPGDITNYLAVNSIPVCEKYWNDIVIQACLTKSPEIILALVPFRSKTGTLYFTKMCILFGLRQVAIKTFTQETSAIEKDGATSILKDVLFNRDAFLNEVHKAPGRSSIETTEDGYTRLIFAAALGDLELCRACIHELGITTKCNDSAYIRALQNKNWDVVQYLSNIPMALPEDISRTDPRYYVSREKGLTQLMMAAANGNIPEMRRYFSQAGQRDILNITALMFACDKENIEGALMLIPKEIGERCNATVWFSGFEFTGASSLMFAVANNNLTLVKMLMSVEARLQDKNGRTALMAAAHFGYLSIIRVLAPLEAGICDKRGKFAIHYAIEYQQQEAAVLLAQTEGLLRDRTGLSAVEYAFRVKQYDLSGMLQYITSRSTPPKPNMGIPYQGSSQNDSVSLKVHLGSAISTVDATPLQTISPNISRM